MGRDRFDSDYATTLFRPPRLISFHFNTFNAPILARSILMESIMDQIPTPIKLTNFEYGANITLRRLMEGTPYESPIHTRKSKGKQRL